MRIRLRETGAVVYDDEFRRLHPNTSFPLVLSNDVLNDFYADPVLEGPQPELTSNQYAQYDGVVEANGQWFTHYIAVDYTSEELAIMLNNWREQAICTPFQGRVALSNAGLLAQVQAAINAADEKTKLAWEYATEWRRNSPMITELGAALSLSDQQIDDLFKSAAQITA